MGEWIKLEDEKPNHGDYRVCKNDEMEFIGLYVEEEDCFFFIVPINHLMYAVCLNLPYMKKIPVTHWLPIPKKP